MAVPQTDGVLGAITHLQELLRRARLLKPETSIEPPLPTSEFHGALGLPSSPSTAHSHNASVELAARQIFQDFLATQRIDEPGFVEIWNLLDILSICGDQTQCDPSLVWWLIEELLDSQRIDGCRVVFDYLESRRERLVTKHFWHKNLVILRAFNELLRRLSRAEEAVFCGRVFIFLFQGFPLGARSSVNPKGEFHKENVTSFEGTPTELSNGVTSNNTIGPVEEPANSQKIDQRPAGETTPKPTTDEQSVPLSEDDLYPIFWMMQEAFSNPPDYFFKNGRINEFKKALDATLTKFKSVPKVNQAAVANAKRGVKRKVDEMEHQDEFANTFNPKYLTSRELFSLELSDLAFQRHILVQALILLDFLLSLTDKAKKRLAQLTTQKALQYPYTLSEQDSEWAEKTKKAIATYLSEGQEGALYYRMVNTVLSRDKNWVRWKLENCPQITRNPVRSQDFNQARDGAKSACATKRLRPTPMGSLDLKFLLDAENMNNLERLSEQTRFRLPDTEKLVKEVAGVELDLEMATTDEERQNLQDSKTSKTWRALRLASKTKLSLFDKVDDGRNLERFVQPHGAGVVNIEGGEITTDGGGVDDDRQPEDPAVGERSEQAVIVEPKVALVES